MVCTYVCMCTLYLVIADPILTAIGLTNTSVSKTTFVEIFPLKKFCVVTDPAKLEEKKALESFDDI